MQILHDTKINFIAKRYMFFFVSAILIVAGILSLTLKGGPNLGIDFKGGILIQLSFDKVIDIDSLRSAIGAEGIAGFELQSSQDNTVIIRMKKKDLDEKEVNTKILSVMENKFPNHTVAVDRTEYVGPAVGRHLVKQTFFAIMFSLLGIIAYVALRFHSGLWGISGVIALAHDVFIVMGIFSIFNVEITLTVIAALLTLAGYSINDTIVIFDRIRENMKLRIKDDFGTIINVSINQTLSRTLMTSLTLLVVVLSLFILGGKVIHDFAFALLIGVIVGTYSSVYIASPLVYEWESYKRKKAVRR